ncbi:hypothetical protein HPP92_024508 [Vanilla planifolia]|uniref:Pentatricopeptide repeat-containing protein n=1 Tax=Vanilla planifolia TaxID=51239 RepID=A0A835UDC0_VANPL|nr:hypothetical protein HPP92_024508 [Vanilla planifolia]
MILAEKMMKLQLMKDASDGTTAPVISSRGMTMLGNPVANPVDNYLGLLRSTSSVQVLHRIHAQLLVRGFLGDPRLLSRFIGVLALSQKNPNHLPYSFLLLPHSPSPPTVYAYNTLIRAHSKSSPDPLAAFALYGQILRSPSLSPDNYTFTFLIRASARLPSASAGAASHAAALRRGHADDPHVQSGLIHLYAGFGSATACRRIFGELRHPDLVTRTAMIGAYAASGEVDVGRHLFDEMLHRDSIAWNAMIAGYTHVGRPREALELFSEMQGEGACVNEATMVSVVTACAQLGALDQGRWAHGYIQKKRILLIVALGTALIDMYSKCGDLGRAMEVFESMPEKNVYTWSSMMSGLAMNGEGKECIELFVMMEDEGLSPNEITFLSVLRGCSIVGMVDKGKEYFQLMKTKYCMKPWPEHYGCMVDLYGRAGQLEEAFHVINTMPCKPHIEAWGALLNACKIHRRIDLGELAMSKIVELKKQMMGLMCFCQTSTQIPGTGPSRQCKGVDEI